MTGIAQARQRSTPTTACSRCRSWTATAVSRCTPRSRIDAPPLPGMFGCNIGDLLDTGSAPITRDSGKSLVIHHRWEKNQRSAAGRTSSTAG
ncbi:hypothetical protein [Nonomuraea sp. NPDC003804]|uniref:hypothetical protein n=1 Tax=Nonomuraea sp. NPDC003804 TaxID=3154547 RepID=UPI0033B99835